MDESFEKSLNLLGLSAERWKQIGKHMFYIGVIKYLSREHSDYTKKNQDFIRNSILNDWVKDPHMKDYPDTLREALGYFNISEEEWIKYGDTVIDMYNIMITKMLKSMVLSHRLCQCLITSIFCDSSIV